MATKIKITSVSTGDPDKPLSPQQMQDWNKFVDFVALKGYKGSTELDTKANGLSKKLMDEFTKLNPNTTVSMDIVPSIQREMSKLKDDAQAFAARRNDPNASKIMAGVSKVDGWPGSKTTSFKFPEMTSSQYRNGNLVAQRNLGLVGSGLTPTGGASLMAKTLPTGVTPEKLNDGHYYYQDPKTGDMVLYK